MTPAERDMFAPKGMSKRIGPESGRTVRSGVSVFRSPHGSVRYMLSEDGEPLSVLQVVETAPGTAVIAQVLTRPEFRRMGLASRLLERARKDYRQVLHSEHLTDEGAQWSKAVGNPGHPQEAIDEALERLDEMIGQLDFSLVQEGEDLSFRKRTAMGYHYTSERNLQAIAREGLGGKVAFEPHEFAFWLAMPYVAPDDAASVLLDAEKDQRRAYSRGEPSQKTLDKLQALLDEVPDLHVVWFYREPGMAGVTAGRRECCVKFNLHDVGEWLSQNADSVNQFTDHADGYAVAWIGPKIPPEFLEDCGEEF